MSANMHFLGCGPHRISALAPNIFASMGLVSENLCWLSEASFLAPVASFLVLAFYHLLLVNCSFIQQGLPFLDNQPLETILNILLYPGGSLL